LGCFEHLAICAAIGHVERSQIEKPCASINAFDATIAAGGEQFKRRAAAVGLEAVAQMEKRASADSVSASMRNP